MSNVTVYEQAELALAAYGVSPSLSAVSTSNPDFLVELGRVGFTPIQAQAFTIRYPEIITQYVQ